jgi:hypothetical protein
VEKIFRLSSVSIGLACLGACAAAGDGAAPVALLEEAPALAYREVARVEVRGLPGTPQRSVRDQLRQEARELGAHAVIVQDERKNYRPAPPMTGSARPASTEGGVYYEAEGIAIRYSDPNPKQN